LGSLHNFFNQGALLWRIFKCLEISTLLILLSLEDEVENGKMALVSQFEDGFDRAKSQAAFLFPELDLSALDSLKIVQEGDLIDET